MDNRIYLCLAHMSGNEMKYIQEAFDTNWVVPLGPNVNAFENDLEAFVGQDKHVVALSAGTAAIHLSLVALGVKAGDEERAKAWFQKQVYLAAGFFIAACGAEGIDPTPMEGIDTLYYTQKLQVKGCKAVLALAVGYHSEADTNHPSKTPKRRLPLEEVVEIR